MDDASIFAAADEYIIFVVGKSRRGTNFAHLTRSKVERRISRQVDYTYTYEYVHTRLVSALTQ